LRVLYFTRDYSPHDERFLSALAQTAHEVFLLRLEPRQSVDLPAGITEVKFTGMVQVNDNPVNNRVTELKMILDQLKPDVVHAGPLHGPAYIAAQTGFSPLVSMSWGADILHDGEVSPLDQEKIRTTLYNSTVLVDDCQAVTTKAVHEYGYPRSRIYCLPWGVDLQHFSPNGRTKLREKMGWQDNFVFLSIRSFEPIYGVDITLRSFIKAVQQDPQLRMFLFGKGSQEEMLRELAAQVGVMDKIHFGGYLDRAQLPDAYNSADVFLSASHCDGSSVSLLEALACGTPAIVSDIPGNLEWVTHGVQGWVFPDGDVEAMTKLMNVARREPDLAEMGERARALAQERANWQQNFKVLLEAYEQAIIINNNVLKKQDPGR